MFTALREKVQESAAPLFSAPANERRRASHILETALAKAKKTGPFAEIVTLTPAMAELLLGNNPENRRMSAIGLAREVADIQRGDWKLNGETVIVAATGELNDGQHRCKAVVESGIAIKTFMVFGVDRDTRDSVDQGIKKTVCHYLGMEGYRDPNNLARAASLAWQYETFGRFSRSPDMKPSAAQVIAFIEANLELSAALPYGRVAYKRKLASIGVYAALHFIFSKINVDQAEEFSTIVTEGDGHKSKTDPAYVLRKRLEEGKGKLSETEIGVFAIKAWNSWRDGESIRVLKFVDGEDFPKAE